MGLNVKLVVVGGDVKTTELKLRLPSTIGRGRGTSIVLPHPLVSRQHCELFESDGQLMVRDLGSLNGTFVNNQRVTESPLPPGELLTVGTVTFRAVYETEGEAGAIMPATVKVGPSDKTLRASKAPTIKATPKEVAPVEPDSDEPASVESDSEVLEFNFDEPLLPEGDEAEAEAAGSAHPTERLSEAMPPAREAKGAEEKGKKGAVKGRAAEDDVTIRADEDADDEVPSDSDDDLNDFLKSL